MQYRQQVKCSDPGENAAGLNPFDTSKSFTLSLSQMCDVRFGLGEVKWGNDT